MGYRAVNALIANGEPAAISRDATKVCYEAVIVIAIGKMAKRFSEAKPLHTWLTA